MLAQAAQGQPTRFITLTVDPKYYSSPQERLLKLSWAWRTVVKRLRREHRGVELEYFAVVEATLKGEPHLHILFRGPFIPQAQLSNYMSELIHSPIVDIRRVKNTDAAVRYVAKYITKKPEQFGTAKRYWQSAKYKLESESSEWTKPADSVKWSIWRDSLLMLCRLWVEQGLAPRKGENDSWIAIPTTWKQEDYPPWIPASEALSSFTIGRPTPISSSTPTTSQLAFPSSEVTATAQR